MEGTKLVLSPDSLDAIAEKAHKKGTKSQRTKSHLRRNWCSWSEVAFGAHFA